MKDTINKILRDKGILDNGVSDILAQVCEEMTYNVIREQISFAGIATACMQGLLANPKNSGEVTERVADEAIAFADALHQKLYKRIEFMETPTEGIIQ